VSEHLIERMLVGGARKIGFVISPGKSDILEYYGGQIGEAQICYFVQRQPAGLCDAIFQTLPFISPDEDAIVGLPDTLWFPVDGLRALGDGGLSFLLFPVARPELFDAVITNEDGRVTEIQVKQAGALSNWIWGAFKLSGVVMRELYDLWCRRDPPDEYIGTLVNAYLALGGTALGVRAGESYVDVGTLNGYREANQLLDARRRDQPTELPPLPLKAVSPLL
jgi:dTDP-glucose pyrophosphorylase